MPIQLLCPLLNGVVWFFFCCWVVWVLYIFEILTSYWIYHLQISSPICLVVFSFYWWFPLLYRSFLVWCNLSCLFLPLFSLPEETYLEDTAEINVEEHTAYVFFSEIYGFRSYIQVFNPFWNNLCMVWDSGLVSFFCTWPSSFRSTIYLFIYVNLFIYLFLAALGLCCCSWAFSSCGERGLLFVVVRGLLIVVASLVAEHGL